MQVERSGSVPFESVATTRSVPSSGMSAADVREWPASDQMPPVGSNSFARDVARSACSISGHDPAIFGVAPQPEGEPNHDAYLTPAVRRRVSIQRCSTWGAVAPARGRSATFVGQAKLGLRGRPHTAPAVRQGRTAHPFHSATAGKVVGGEHTRIRASAERSTPGQRYVKGGERHE